MGVPELPFTLLSPRHAPPDIELCLTGISIGCPESRPGICGDGGHSLVMGAPAPHPCRLCSITTDMLPVGPAVDLLSLSNLPGDGHEKGWLNC